MTRKNGHSESSGEILKMKKNAIYIISLLFVLFFRLIPAPAGMTASGMQVLGIFAGVLILWLTTSIDWPSLLCIAGLSLVPELPMSKILSTSFGNSTFSFLLFTFMCTYAVAQTSFVRRCAIAFITNRVASRGSWWFITTYCLSVLLIGMFMSPSVLFVIYMPILNEICKSLGLGRGDRLASTLVMGTLFCCAASCGMTPIAHTFAVMAFGFYQQMAGGSVSYLTYMGAAIPVGLICFVFMILMFRFLLRPETDKLKSLDLSALKADVKPFDNREKAVLAIFFAVIVMWILPDLTKSVFPAVSKFFSSRGILFPPMLGSIVMFILSVDGRPLLNFREVMSKGIQWGSVVMAAATLAVGGAMTNPEIGLTKWMSAAINPVISGLSPVAIVLAVVVWAYVMTNTCSNMVTVTVVCAVAIPICMNSGGTLNAAALASMIGMGASYAIVLPPAHPNVALAIGTGWTNTSQVTLYGGILMIAAIIATVLVGYPLACALMV